MLKKRMYPSYVMVKGQRYDLHLTPYIAIGKAKPNEVIGWCAEKDKFILIHSGLSEKDAFSTLIHELLHAIDEEYGVRIPHKLIYQLEGALAETISANFHLVPKR